jgi:uncharacterized membrane protein YedE/YeeE
MKPNHKSYMNPYLAGVFLGLVLLASFVVLGAGLGASGGISRMAASLEGAVASQHTLGSAYFGQWGPDFLNYYLVYMLVGILLGGVLSAAAAGRIQLMVEKGGAFPAKLRMLYAVGGGFLVGFASRLAQGCTSGQALTGGALLLNGSLVFMVSLFASGYATAWLFGRQWHD